MPDERYIFPAAVEGMMKGLGKRATPELKAHLKSKGLDVDKPAPAIRVEEWTPHLLSAATFTWPELRDEEALRLLGLHFIRGWQSTTMGAAMSVMLRLLGPSRTLTRLDRAFRTSDNFTRATTVLVSDTEAFSPSVPSAPRPWSPSARYRAIPPTGWEFSKAGSRC